MSGVVDGEIVGEETAPTEWGASVVLALLLTAVAIGVIVWGPILTNDGPVHVVFAHLMRHDLGGDLQREVYERGAALVTNAFGELLMSEVMRVVSPDTAESLLQALCLVAPVAAGAACVRAVNPNAAWAALLFLPLSLHEMFFLGLYNFTLSIALFLLVLGTFLKTSGRIGIVGMTVVVAELVAAFVVHPSSFIAAWVCLAAMAVGVIVAGRGAMREALAARRHLWAALILSLAIVAVLHEPATGEGIDYGRPPLWRLLYFVSGWSLGTNLATNVLAGVYMLVLGAITVVSLKGTLRRATIRRLLADEKTVAVVSALVGSLVLMMVFPDTFGGGWTHFRRFVLYPLHVVVLIPALLPVSRRIARLGAASAIAVFVALAGDGLFRQAQAHAQMARHWVIDRAIGEHCTVLPIILETRPIGADGREIGSSYRPFFQSFNRLELTGDRVVLFDFLARLDVYPITYRPRRDPHETLFGWRRSQHETTIDFVDVEAYERVSGLHVDHVLLLGRPERRAPALRAGIEAAIAGAVETLRSDNGRMVLFRRTGGTGASRCREPAVTDVGGGGAGVG